MLFVLILGTLLSVIAVFLSPPMSVYYARILLDAKKVSSGFVMYRDIYDHAGIIPVYLNAFLISIGASGISKLIGALIIVANAIYLNYVVDRFRLLEERSFVPALVALIFGFSIYQGLELNAFLLGNFFILFALSELLKLGEEGTDAAHNSFMAGSFIGLAFFCDQAFLLFFLGGCIGLFYYSKAVKQHILMMIAGIFFPFIFFLIFYLFAGAQDYFFRYFLYRYFVQNESSGGATFMTLLPWIVITLVALMLYGVKRAGISFKNYTSKAHQLIIFLLFLGIGVMLFTKEHTLSSGMLLVNPMAFLGSFYLLYIKRKWIAEGIVLLLFSLPVFFHFYTEYNPLISNENIEKGNITPFPQKYDAPVLVLAYEPGMYLNNDHASCFTNWKLEQKSFLNLNKPGNLEKIYLGITREYPYYIYDPNDIFIRIQDRIPLFRKKYKRLDSKTYRLR